jgi:hypothetical protein
MAQNAPHKFLGLIDMTILNSFVPKSEAQAVSRPITTCLILQERGWILEKMAVRLADNLAAWNVVTQISYLPSPQVEINHWMHYLYLEGGWHGKNTLSITHVDRPAKLHILKKRMKKADMGVCMSRMTLEQLVLAGIPRQKLCYITPAHDGNVKPKRIVIGITSQIRPDGAKREDVLIQMSQAIRLDAFHFEIIGPNWEKVIPYFLAVGATVNYNPGMFMKNNEDHLRIVNERLNSFDYYLYMGWDEGSMGFLDALAAGIPTIVTPQGFHLDINNGITYSFTDALDLCAILDKLAQERQSRIDSVSGLTWNEYARQHALVWQAVVAGRQEGINASLHNTNKYLIPLPNLSGVKKGVLDPQVKPKYNFASLKNDLTLLLELYTNIKFQNTLLGSFVKWVKSLLSSTVKK